MPGSEYYIPSPGGFDFGRQAVIRSTGWITAPVVPDNWDIQIIHITWIRQHEGTQIQTGQAQQ
jgi:hypothetical protein